MSGEKGPFPNHFDWSRFEQFFGGQLPSMPPDGLKNPAWIDHVIQDVMKRAFPGTAEVGARSPKYRSELFETHSQVLVKCHIPAKEARALQVKAGISRVRLEGDNGEAQQTIRLPAPVEPESCRAVYRQGVLQIQLKKNRNSTRLHAVPIRFMD